jgi:uncharacterized repeat protein (TIGR01451 family)
MFALYVVFILVSQIPLIAEQFINTDDMVDRYECVLTFPKDGKQGHYYVERYDTSKIGRIDLEYITKTNSLDVDCRNIKVLRIFCREMYDDKSEDVFYRDPELDSNYYKTYFITRDYFHVSVYTHDEITELSFIDTPIPYNVTVNNHEWWLSKINYTYYRDGIVLSKVPAGQNYVDIYFQSNDINSPVAKFSSIKTVIGTNEEIELNASSSYDPDGRIISYVWDMGDGTYKGDEVIKYSFNQEGSYKVILTVTDDDYLIDRAYEEIIVVDRVMRLNKLVDKPIATPGSVLTYTIAPAINTSWQEGVKDIVVSDTLPPELDYKDASPLPIIENKTIIWTIGMAFNTSELTRITLEVTINEMAKNNTIISNYAQLEYTGITGQAFPEEHSNAANTKVNVGSILAPRIRERVSDIELPEDAPPLNLYLNGYEYDYQDSGVDLMWYITNENESLYILAGEESKDDIITITPIPDAFGNSLVTLWLRDSEGYSTSQPLWINITPVDDPPVFNKAPDLIIHHGEPYTFNYEPYISDKDTPLGQLVLYATENTEGQQPGTASSENHVQVTDFKVIYAFPESYIGQQMYVSLVVFDGTNSDGDTVSINITEDYTPILRDDLPDIWLEEGETKYNVFDLDDFFDDPDADSLFYSFGETHITVIIHENHSVDISSQSNWNGIDTITFRARDPIGAIAEDTIMVTVSPVNDPPVISGVPEVFIVHYEADYGFDLSPYISDEDDSFLDLFLILVDEHIRIDILNHLKIIMNYPKSMVGQDVSVRLSVSDGIATGYTDVTVRVTDNWPPELRLELSDISFKEDEELINVFNLNDYFVDRDSNTLFYSYGQDNVNIFINSDGSVDFNATSDWHGIEIVTFRATDPTSAFVESVIKVTVIPVNDPPKMMPLPNLEGVVKRLFKIDLSEYLSDVDNNITELSINTESTVLDITIIGRELIIYSEKPVTETITVKVTDGQSEVSNFMLIEIHDDDSKAGSGAENMIFNIMLLLLIVIIIVSLTGFASYRKYAGNYRIEEIFWIYNNGILISHVSSKKTKHRADDSVVSGMLTAIMNFTQDAFMDEEKGETAWGIKEIQMNEKNILVERGKHTFLATVFTGRSGKRLYLKSQKVLTNLETKHNKLLLEWTGNINRFIGSKKIIELMLSANVDDTAISKK